MHIRFLFFMPTRTSRRTSAAPVEKKSVVMSPTVCCRPTVTMVWIVSFFMFLALWLVLFVHMVRLDRLEMALRETQQVVLQLEQARLANMPVPETGNILPASAPTTTEPETISSVPPAVSPDLASPSGLLHRGSWNSDVTRYAGYDETTKGKIGIGVEIPATKQVKHIVIFNAVSESTGKGMPEESSMSVRFKDDHTIEYDVLVKKSGQWVKDTQTVQIYF